LITLHSMLSGIFKILGLASKDERIYIAALKLGPQPASVIARKACTKRVDTYNHLKDLCEKGVFIMEIKNSIMYFSPCPPGKILEMLKIKRLIVLDAENKLKMLLPILRPCEEETPTA